MARQYSKAASAKVGKVLAEQNRGQLKSGGSGKTVTSCKQAIAIALSEARREGKKVPKQTAASRKKAARRKTAKKTATRARR